MISAGSAPTDRFDPHPNWTIEVSPTQIELEHRFQAIEGATLLAATATTAALFAGYWAAMTLTAAFAAPETHRAVAYGGIVVVLGGSGFHYFLVLRRLLTVSRYRFRGGALDVEIQGPLRKTSQEIVWAEVQELKYVTRTRKHFLTGPSHRLILDGKGTDGRRRSIAFAGNSETEAKFLGPIAEAWCRKPIQHERC